MPPRPDRGNGWERRCTRLAADTVSRAAGSAARQEIPRRAHAHWPAPSALSAARKCRKPVLETVEQFPPGRETAASG